jgi:hypothetical protein
MARFSSHIEAVVKGLLTLTQSGNFSLPDGNHFQLI